MNKFFKSRMMRSMIPYFILILGAILIFRVSAEFRFFSDIVGRFWSIISPFLVGAIVAYILNLPCSALQRLIGMLQKIPALEQNHGVHAIVRFIVRKSRAFAVLLLLAIIVVIFSFILNIIIPAISSSVNIFLDELRGGEAILRGWIANLDNLDLPEFIQEHLSADVIISSITYWITSFDFNGMLNGLVAGFGGFAASMFGVFLSIVSSLYLLFEKDKIKTFAIKLIGAVTSEGTNETILKYSRKLDFNFRQYIFAQTIDGLILGTIMIIVLLIFGSEFALVLGLILGIVNYIPYFGSIFGTAIAVLVVAFTQGIPTAALAAVIMFAIQQFDGNFIQPKLMGKTFSLSPLLVIISVTIGLNYGGIFGMLVAIPIVAILKDLLDTYIAHREEIKNAPPKANDDFMNSDVANDVANDITNTEIMNRDIW